MLEVAFHVGGVLVQSQVWMMGMNFAIGMDIGKNVNHELTL